MQYHLQFVTMPYGLQKNIFSAQYFLIAELLLDRVIRKLGTNFPPKHYARGTEVQLLRFRPT